jgi:hypothetical protein
MGDIQETAKLLKDLTETQRELAAKMQETNETAKTLRLQLGEHHAGELGKRLGELAEMFKSGVVSRKFSDIMTSFREMKAYGGDLAGNLLQPDTSLAAFLKYLASKRDGSPFFPAEPVAEQPKKKAR